MEAPPTFEPDTGQASVGFNTGFGLVFLTTTCLGLLALLVFVKTDFGLPPAAITKRLFGPAGFGRAFGFGADEFIHGYEASFNLLVWSFAFVFPIVIWLAVAARLVRRLLRMGRTAPAAPAGDGPPSPHDPAVVATLWGNGSPAPDAVAGTVLSLAAQRRIEIQDLPGRAFVVRIRSTDGGATSATETIVMDALRQAADPTTGEIGGPPLWPSPVSWWRAVRTDAVRRAAAAGLAVRATSSRLLLLAALLTGLAFVLVRYVDSPTLFFTLVVLVPLAISVLTRRVGYALTAEGRELRGRWAAYAARLAASADIAAAPPAAVIVMGPELAYGAVLGVATAAARDLTPPTPGPG